MLQPACPSAGPIGGAGLAAPAGICKRIKPVTFFALIDLHFVTYVVIELTGVLPHKLILLISLERLIQNAQPAKTPIQLVLNDRKLKP